MNHYAVKMFPGVQQQIDEKEKKKTSTISNKLVENAVFALS